MDILGIETSCDETAAAIVRDGGEVVSNVVYTQIPLHQPYGGVVPEIASRAHVEKIREVVSSALGGRRVDAVAATFGPGLSPALIVGYNAAKGLAAALGAPLFAVNHMEAHLHTPFLDTGLDPRDFMPALGLAVSGGHTMWIDMPEYGKYETIGRTLDDAAGEAFDKASKLLGLGYPGGPVIDKVAKEWRSRFGGDDKAFRSSLVPFPKGRVREGVDALGGLDAKACVSFSGLKTSLLRHVQKNGGAEALAAAGEIPRIVASYQEAIVDAVAECTARLLGSKPRRALVVGGGVSLNSRLRERLGEVAADSGAELLLAKPKYCGDNGAMIAGVAYWRRVCEGDAAMSLDISPSLETGQGNANE